MPARLWASPLMLKHLSLSHSCLCPVNRVTFSLIEQMRAYKCLPRLRKPPLSWGFVTLQGLAHAVKSYTVPWPFHCFQMAIVLHTESGAAAWNLPAEPLPASSASIWLTADSRFSEAGSWLPSRLYTWMPFSTRSAVGNALLGDINKIVFSQWKLAICSTMVKFRWVWQNMAFKPAAYCFLVISETQGCCWIFLQCLQGCQAMSNFAWAVKPFSTRWLQRARGIPSPRGRSVSRVWLDFKISREGVCMNEDVSLLTPSCFWAHWRWLPGEGKLMSETLDSQFAIMELTLGPIWRPWQLLLTLLGGCCLTTGRAVSDWYFQVILTTFTWADRLRSLREMAGHLSEMWGLIDYTVALSKLMAMGTKWEVMQYEHC